MSHGLACVSSDGGEILEILRDELGALVVGARFPDRVDPASRDKAERLLELVAREGVAHEWQLELGAGGELHTLCFSAARLADRVVLLGAATRSEVGRLYEDLLRINNEQTNAIRSASAESSLHELSALNNELAALHREMAKKSAELARLNEEKNQLLGMVAHDLRNPIGAIAGYARLLLGGVTGPVAERQRALLERVEGSAARMLAMVEELVDFSAIGSSQVKLELAELDLVALVTEVRETASLAAEAKSIAVDQPPCPPISIRGDPGKLRQVFENLLSNAIKFSQPGTRVEIAPQATAHAAFVAVRDRGPGIPPEELGQLFRPFGKTSVRGTAGEKSTGLGLAIVHRIVEAHHGTIAVESAAGSGTSFVVRLPFRRD